MTNKIFKEKKKTILYLSIFILFVLTLAGCNWFGEGILNVFDPKAQIRVNYTNLDISKGGGTIDLEIYSINQVEFIGEGFEYKFHNKGVLIPELTKTVGMAFYVAPSNNPGMQGPITKITDLHLYYQDALDYADKNPKVTEITCTINLKGTDGAGHKLTAFVTFDLPALQPGVDFEPPIAKITAHPGTSGIPPFTVQFDASQSTDNRGMASYSWDFGDSTPAGTEVMPPAHTYTEIGSYIVVLTVTDYWGNIGHDVVVINVGVPGEDGEGEAPPIVSAIKTIIVSANPQYNVPGGKSTIQALVLNSAGQIVPDTTVFFYSNSGQLSNDYKTTLGDGISTVYLVLDDNMEEGEKAVVTAFIGNIEEKVTITCIDQPINIYIQDYNIYEGAYRVEPGKNFEITAVVTDTKGDPITNTVVYFYSKNEDGDDVGSLVPKHKHTNSEGVAKTTLILDPDDKAIVTAKCGSRVSNVIEIIADKY